MPDTLPQMPVTSTRLYYRDGSSDKEYHAAINTVPDGHTVTFAYGRRGSALTAGTKTGTPVSLEKAQHIYDKIVAEKTAKGYTPDGAGARFTDTNFEKRVSGLVPQLLNSIEPQEAQRHLADDVWCMQEKFDGKRIMVAVQGDTVEGSNRKGLCVCVPQEVVDSLRGLPDCDLDGELLGTEYVVFDLLRLDGSDLRHSAYRVRYEALRDVLRPRFGPCARTAETAWEHDAKRALYRRIEAAGGEGVVFKRVDGQSVAGRPASGGSQIKCKFYATCTCLVTARNDQRSVRLSLLDEAGTPIHVGNVTIFSNKPVPEAGALVEIRYLYAYKGGSLYQPIFLGERDDLTVGDCTLAQLKYKLEGAALDAEDE